MGKRRWIDCMFIMRKNMINLRITIFTHAIFSPMRD